MSLLAKFYPDSFLVLLLGQFNRRILSTMWTLQLNWYFQQTNTKMIILHDNFQREYSFNKRQGYKINK